MNRLLLIGLLLSSFGLHAQVQVPGCPPGVVPGQPGCGGGDEVAPTYTGPVWQDRYGAIAVDPATGSIGWASAAKNRKDARDAAIADCGGRGCKIQMEGRNACLAVAWGGASGFAAEATSQRAEEVALSHCAHAGGAACKIQYSACSLPVRIR